MSLGGAGNVGALNLIGSFAGAQRSQATENEQKAAAADRQFALDQKAISARSLGDVSATDESSDRDADGRMPYDSLSREAALGQAEEDERKARQMTPDAFGERGVRLDLEA